MRRLLLLTYHFPPSAASGTFRMLGFARHLPRYGWQTIVVAPPRLPWEPDDPELLRQVPAETVIFPVLYPSGSLLRRLGPFSVWLPKGLATARTAIQEHHPDAVFTSGPPHVVHLLGLILNQWYGLPWIADFRDPWVADGQPSAHLSWSSCWEARLERLVFEQAGAIIANVPRAGEVISEAYPALRHKVHIICNGYDRETFETSGDPVPVPRKPCELIEMVHAGAIYAGRDPRPLLDAVAALARSPQGLPQPLHLLMLGPKPEYDGFDLGTEIQRRGLESTVTIGGQVPYAKAVASMKRAGILLLIDSPGRRIGVPAKVYEYIGAGRPILALGECDGDLAWVLGESGVPHRIAAPTDPGEISRALVDLARQAVAEDGSSADKQGRLKFTRTALAEQLAEILDHCITPASSSMGRGVRTSPAPEAALRTAR